MSGDIIVDGQRVAYGPWVDEPDRLDFACVGFPCAMRRGMVGAWCGYVGVPHGHPWHGVEYDNIQARVHGGLTYSRFCLPAEDSDCQWYVGFDCAHGWDIVPGMARYNLPRLFENAAYRDVSYVRKQVQRLAVQASKAAR